MVDDDHSLKPGGALPNDLSPTLIKSMLITETKAGTSDGGTGTSSSDVLQVNVPGDWADEKRSLGLTFKQVMTPKASIEAAIGWLFQKGLEFNDKGQGEWEQKDGGWNNAVMEYGPGKDAYPNKVFGQVNSSTTPSPKNYPPKINVNCYQTQQCEN